MKSWRLDKQGKTPSCFKLTLHDQLFLPFGSKENLRIRSGRRRRWVGHIDCRRDTSVHRELRKQTITQECIVWISQESKRLPTVLCILLGYSRIWHNMPCHPGAQWQTFEPTHSPPFRHFCRQLAERQKQASRWVTAVNCWREAPTENDYLPLILSSLVSGCLLGNCFFSSVLLRSAKVSPMKHCRHYSWWFPYGRRLCGSIRQQRLERLDCVTEPVSASVWALQRWKALQSSMLVWLKGQTSSPDSGFYIKSMWGWGLLNGEPCEDFRSCRNSRFCLHASHHLTDKQISRQHTNEAL